MTACPDLLPPGGAGKSSEQSSPDDFVYLKMPRQAWEDISIGYILNQRVLEPEIALRQVVHLNPSNVTE